MTGVTFMLIMAFSLVQIEKVGIKWISIKEKSILF